MTAKKKRKFKKSVKIVFGMELVLLGVVGLIFFTMGKNTGERKAQEAMSSVESGNVQNLENSRTEVDENAASAGKDDLDSGKRADNNNTNNEINQAQDEEEDDKPDILLVNKDNRLPTDYEVTLMTLPDGVNRAAEEAYEPLCDMLAAGRKEGLNFEICSSYRSVERQQELFDEDVDALMRVGYSYLEAYDEVEKETMPPGYSEHSTGLAFDIVSLGYQMLDDYQENTAENKWLQEHCAEYGFILRYPEGKEEITKINYESWHFRYVGVEVAEYIMENGITLEEYLEL